EGWFAIFIFLLVLVFFIGTFQYSMFSTRSVIGEGFLPRTLSFIIICLVAIYIWKAFRNRSKFNNVRVGTPEKKVVKNQILLLVMLVGCLFLINILGMLLSLGLFIVLSLRYLERISWKISIIFGVGGVVAIFLIFIQGLGIRLPS